MPAATLAQVAPAFVAMAHRIVWATVATIDPRDRPRTRILHPLWAFDGTALHGVVATGPTPAKSADLAHRPFASVAYWNPDHDTCRADCHVRWSTDDDRCTEVWEAMRAAPEPVGYDPAIVPAWEAPGDESFAVLELEPYRLRVFPGSVLLRGEGEVLTWSG